MGDVGNTYYILHVIYYTLTYNSKLGIDTVTAVEGYMPASHSGAPKCPPITSRCDCNKHDYYCMANMHRHAFEAMGIPYLLGVHPL